MNYFAHLLFSFALVYGLLYAFSLIAPIQIPVNLQTIAVIGLGALLPDVDHPKTKVFKLIALLFLIIGTAFIHSAFFSSGHEENLNNSLNAITGFAVVFNQNVIAWVVSFLAALVLFGIILLLKPKHRTITHSPLAALLFAAAVALITKSVFYGITGFAAYTSHLLVDKIS
ncbi:metal-dependent hydrolase [Candidatus Micrarchaeota archaeon]|nr:metal-dependent hydrolase [Candidatus Micrarchaeota archaeon]